MAESTDKLVTLMSTVKALERQVQELDPKELAQFRDWFLEFEADAWDRQIERDAKAGKLDAFARKALEDHAAGRTTLL
jgi:hypothetical protein